MTIYAKRLIPVLGVLVAAVAILSAGALAQADPQSPAELAKYGWGAAATYAKVKRTTVPQTTMPTPAELAKHGWGAAATYAKAMRARRASSTSTSLPGELTDAELASYGWGAAATFAKAMKRGR